MNRDEHFEKQKRTFEAMYETTRLVEEAVVAREGLKKIFMVGLLSAMSVAFSKFIGALWEIDSPALLILPTVMLNYSLYAIYDVFVQKETVPVHVSIASAFMKKNPDFYTRMEEAKNGSDQNEQSQ